jgi:DNA end-binding protein Ku
MAARSIWNGTIAFGLVNVPVKVHSATSDSGVHFHEVHLADGARIQHKRFCSKERNKEVPYEEVVKGYEVKAGEYVELSKEELDAAAGERSKVIDVTEFVPAEQIDPDYFLRSYYLGVREQGEPAKAYRLLHDALQRTDRIAIGRWTFHNRDYLVAIRPLDGPLVLHTMRFAAELVPPAKVELPKPQRKPSKQEIDMAAMLVERLHGPFDAQKYRDEYRDRVLALVKRKAKGQEIELPEREEPEPADDLAAALEASLGSQKGPRKRGSSHRKPQRRSRTRGGKR